MKLQNKTTAFYVAFVVLMLPVLMSCTDRQQPAETAPVPAKDESFTFFDLGINTRLNSQCRKELKNKLGSDAIEHRSIVDLEINYKGFLKKYFQNLDELNRILNFPPGERVEHNTVKLTYRYAQKQNMPFKYVELIFSDYTKTPLLFKIIFQKDEAGIVKKLKKKYGLPEVIDWQEENGTSMFWKKNTDFLIVSLVPDQFGRHDYHIVIIYVDNMKQLIATEKNERRKSEQKRDKLGKTAF